MRTTANSQVPGFKDSDTYKEVVARGARGLGIICGIDDLQFVVSGGVVIDSPLQGVEPWTLGAYVNEIGGQAARGKKAFGLCLLDDGAEEQEVC